MAACSVDLRFIVLVLFFSLGHSQATWPPIDLSGTGVLCNMSSVYKRDGFQTNCHAAINGNTFGDYSPSNCIHTDYTDNSPFWWVDMGQEYSVHRIKIYPRNGQTDRMSRLHVFIDQREVPHAVQARTSQIDINGGVLPVTGRRVKITRDEVFINICEVQIYVCNGNLVSPYCTEHVTCGQSSVYSGNQGALSLNCSAAIDSDTDNHWESFNGPGPAKCFSTNLQIHPYWWVDLGHAVNIHKIIIYIDDDGYLDNAVVSLDGQLQIFTFTLPSKRSEPYVITSHLPRAGRNISVHYPQTWNQAAYVVLCEVQIWGEMICDGNLTSTPCSEQVSCGQSSILTNSSIAETKWDTEIRGTSANCYAAINGNTDHHWVGVNGPSPPNCFSTAFQQHPFWWVDLGHNVNIHKIVIHIEYHGLLNDAVISLESQLIFNFPPVSNNKNPYIITSPLPRAGRNISVHYPQNDTGNAYVILCEVQIWGCPLNKHGGPDCENYCSAHCYDNGGKTTCDSITGNCTTGCKDGWWGGQCDWECPQRCFSRQCDRNEGCQQCSGNFIGPLCAECADGHYGSDCQSVCGNCTGGAPCHKQDGHCDTCAPGWDPPVCQTECVDHHYGQNCTDVCGHCTEGAPCNRQDGHCDSCVPGWAPPLCHDCADHYYGQNCTVCGDCAGDAACNKQDGHCDNCEPGWSPPLCQTGCEDRHYGQNCTGVCGHCAGDAACNKQDGHCDNCQPGWSSPLCQDCADHYYGQNCTGVCGHCAGDAACNKQDGHCDNCQPGWSLPLCEKECIGGLYGVNCTSVCGNCTEGAPCDKQNGNCTSCEPGWYEPNCQIACSKGHFGQNCNETCGSCLNNSACEPTVGKCLSGCSGGFEGNQCKLVSPDSSPGVAVPVAVAASVVVGAVVVVAVICYRRRRPTGRDDAKDRPEKITEIKGSSSSGRSKSMTSIGFQDSQDRSQSRKEDKPKVPVKPMQRSGAYIEESSAGPLYGNIPQRASSKTCRPPGLTPKPQAPQNVDNVYANAPIPVAQSSASHRAKAPRRGKPPGDDGLDDLVDVLADEADDTYNTDDLYSSYMAVANRPRLDSLQDYLLCALASGELLNQQFAKFEKGMKLPHNDGMTDKNVSKNRFKAMCAYDFNRVYLRRPEGDTESDYINASYIRGCRGDKQYIATQGPRDNTVADLWLMVWQEKVTQMVMLTNIQEDGKDKCEEYWPASGTSKTCAHLLVEAVEEEQRADYVIRMFSLKDKGRSSELGRQVIQYHYNTWPDHGVPQAAALVDFWRYVKVRGDPTVPLLVHCSAGVGRTGTLIALDIASEREALGREVNVKDIVTELREQRCIMVQSQSQYKFLHEVILEAHTSRDTRIGVVKFEEIFPDTITVDKPDERIDGEFKMLQEMGKHAPKPTHAMAEIEENRHKNRNQDALPDDKHLAYLTVHVRGRNQYINAVYMSSFLHHRGLLLTQLPIPNHTMVDFWRMVDGCDVKTVVSLGSEVEREAVNNFCQYWPLTAGEVMTTGPFAVTINSHNKMNNHLTSYGLTLKNKTENREHALQLFHYQAWAGEVPDDTATLLQLVDTIKARDEEDMTSPIVIQCIDGAARSGLFCAIYDIISRVTHDDEIDVYLTSRHVQTVRPQAVATETQYRFLYHVAQEYVRSLNVYQNVRVS